MIWAFGVVGALVALAVLASALGVLGRAVAAGPGMEPTISSGSSVLYHRTYTSVRRGDIVLYLDRDRRTLLSRIAATPGQSVEIRGGQLIVDGNALDEPYVKEPMRYSVPPIRLAGEEYYVLGDNRNGSTFDSHVSGPISQSQILGVAY